ncbi:phosphoribosyltransferase [Cryobacterium sp. TMT1-21]|uniref:Phosphoribosyltransferase n=1 Tax=Cryobacterium shii TaxID=1259235 RepID=A0AAQ2HGS4_9MICO|nr:MULTISPECIES: phosphoribosyltransferase family protein [Cryobacterium]TFC52562.1 phosphoribosyltransferase [Cryobacterium shii]TFC82342.1 phosphoribosyltransferase [Cryobacterium sp. TmT2-59]TFD13945.1 phosphoribosyltransferase [Cryobacterium sp. TMT4-10]TFD16345.1 phosphoribosyltransferase [Cryobacterium sp. TMT1-21]TFD27934.1 phosphoribosyltransferase [Cryobacterium sp. TMT2-23]
MFTDRSEAGRLLADRVAERLAELRRSDPALSDPVVYALPRGGVPVAVEVARRLHAPLDLVLVRKIGAPGYPEVAMGAVVDGVDRQTILNEDVFAATGGDAAGLSRARSRELAEIERRRIRYLGDRPQISPAGRVAVIVDDGLATGATAKAALSAVKRQGARLAVLAVPVAPADSIADMLRYADEMIVLQTPRDFWAIGPFYRDFHQLSDDETVQLLREAWARRDETATGDV